MTELKSLRMGKKMTQKEVAENIGVSLRSYIMYENDESRVNSPKYRFILQELEKMNVIDEEHGILSLDEIGSVCSTVFSEYQVDFCYLFGSYAKGIPSESSDVDLLIATKVTGLRFVGIIERLRENLRKKVDLLDMKQIVNNEQLLYEILKTGVKIYG